jgi:hypothetical protein
MSGIGNTALVRVCDTCGVVTAIDAVVTVENMRGMTMIGSTVKQLPIAEAIAKWEKPDTCRCNRKHEEVQP